MIGILIAILVAALVYWLCLALGLPAIVGIVAAILVLHRRRRHRRLRMRRRRLLAAAMPAARRERVDARLDGPGARVQSSARTR